MVGGRVPDPRHEEKQPAPGGIWIYPSKNDRIIHAWQAFAGRYDEKTKDRHLAAIRQMEELLDDKRFDKLSVTDIERVREHLKSLLKAEGDRRKSRSTVSHIASHMRAFLEWLIKQDFCMDLPRDLPDYLKLPRSAYAESPNRKPRTYPSIEEAEALLRSMPFGTMAQRRDQAIFASAFLCALRADTIASLRLKHVDLERKTILQDGTVSRTKNGKSLEIKWFPIPEVFAETVSSWVNEMTEFGLQPDDALFPDLKHLERKCRPCRSTLSAIPPMRSKHAVTKAFKVACQST